MAENPSIESAFNRALAAILEIAGAPLPLEAKLRSALVAILAAGEESFLSQGSVFLLDAAGGVLRLAATCNLPADLLHDCTIVPLGHCVCGRVAEERHTVFLSHPEDGQRREHAHYCAPILSGEALLGVLNVYARPHRALGIPEQEFLVAVAHGLSLLIDSHRSAESLTLQRDLLRKVLDHIPLRVFWKDCHSVYRGCNLNFARDAGIATPDEIVGKSDVDLPGRCREADVYQRRDQTVLATGQALRGYEELRRFADGSEAMITGNLLPLQLADGTIDGVLGIYADVTGQYEAEHRLHAMRSHDQLTGLPNQLLFRDRLEQAVVAAGRGQKVFGLICLDLDNFKKINNTFGHPLGDEVLCRAGERLVRALFNTDTVGRMGGDNFVLLLKELNHREDITLALRKVRKAFEHPFEIAGHEVYVTVSMGVALFPDDGDSAKQLLKNADTALHQAKLKGRGGYQLYSPGMNASALMWLSMEGQLRQALERRQFEVYYQPQVDARSGSLVGAEALVRWQHPELGTVAPGDFITLAEETGLIVELGAWVLNEACVQAKQWQDAGLELERVAVNLSPRQFQHHDIVATVCAALLDSGLAPSMLELEITESAMMHDSEQAASALHYFREMGVRIAIDDFGTGYSSLTQLKKFPFTLLKIDQTFVRGIGNDDDDDAIVTAVIAMAHRLGLKVLAEGVETTGQRDFLLGSGCDELQGYLFGRPLPAAQFADLLSPLHAVVAEAD